LVKPGDGEGVLWLPDGVRDAVDVDADEEALKKQGEFCFFYLIKKPLQFPLSLASAQLVVGHGCVWLLTTLDDISPRFRSQIIERIIFVHAFSTPSSSFMGCCGSLLLSTHHHFSEKPTLWITTF
jgi:hypothetical protein